LTRAAARGVGEALRGDFAALDRRLARVIECYTSRPLASTRGASPMISRIEQDHSRFREIIRGKVRQNLRKYMARGDIIAPQGKGSVTIPMPQINIPRFTFGDNSGGGVGQGEGQPGDPVDGAQQPGQGKGKAGEGEGDKALEIEVSLDELAEILGEELGLPRIQPKGVHALETRKDRYVGLRSTGPESLRSFKATYKRALRRQIAMGTYDPRRPVIVPIREDRRYRSWRTDPRPHSNAVIIYMMDVSGSMGDEQKEIVRIESFWIDTWLRSQYKGLQSRYIIHDATARLVEREVFFRTRESGRDDDLVGVQALQRADRRGVRPRALEHLRVPLLGRRQLVPVRRHERVREACSATCCCRSGEPLRLRPGRVSQYGSGQFIKDLARRVSPRTKLLITVSEIKGREEIMDSHPRLSSASGR
jgi:hypothetical protein